MDRSCPYYSLLRQHASKAAWNSRIRNGQRLGHLLLPFVYLMKNNLRFLKLKNPCTRETNRVIFQWIQLIIYEEPRKYCSRCIRKFSTTPLAVFDLQNSSRRDVPGSKKAWFTEEVSHPMSQSRARKLQKKCWSKTSTPIWDSKLTLTETNQQCKNVCKKPSPTNKN